MGLRFYAGMLQAARATNQPVREKEYDNMLRKFVETVRNLEQQIDTDFTFLLSP